MPPLPFRAVPSGPWLFCEVRLSLRVVITPTKPNYPAFKHAIVAAAGGLRKAL